MSAGCESLRVGRSLYTVICVSSYRHTHSHKLCTHIFTRPLLDLSSHPLPWTYSEWVPKCDVLIRVRVDSGAERRECESNGGSAGRRGHCFDYTSRTHICNVYGVCVDWRECVYIPLCCREPLPDGICVTMCLGGGERRGKLGWSRERNVLECNDERGDSCELRLN